MKRGSSIQLHLWLFLLLFKCCFSSTHLSHIQVYKYIPSVHFDTIPLPLLYILGDILRVKLINLEPDQPIGVHMEKKFDIGRPPL